VFIFYLQKGVEKTVLVKGTAQDFFYSKIFSSADRHCFETVMKYFRVHTRSQEYPSPGSWYFRVGSQLRIQKFEENFQCIHPLANIEGCAIIFTGTIFPNRRTVGHFIYLMTRISCVKNFLNLSDSLVVNTPGTHL
jgi:hypothetical protein